MTLKVTYLPEISTSTRLFELSDLLDKAERQLIGCSPWKEFTVSDVHACFVIVQGSDCIALKYYVREPFSKPVYFNANDPVYKDSCVEFFIGFNNDPAYYNFEFNNAGTCLLGFGTGRERKYLPKSLIDQIRYSRSFKSTGTEALIGWELTLLIPFEVFCFHSIGKFEGPSCRGNFFKCGDDLPAPHYLAWNNIATDSPNFHLPEFFGTIDFA
ncbi:carbohydrate-binding family 9-like protein [Pedobacter heparinus]|uniref:carbohydrate-binding family 9-like protein n=1 Tax=Pedobacter heparinus TaxID=984 RepID=UPI00292F46E1|nr:carbohydrate-binding family 9-like protein [Pedobacter heparinus]